MTSCELVTFFLILSLIDIFIYFIQKIIWVQEAIKFILKKCVAFIMSESCFFEKFRNPGTVPGTRVQSSPKNSGSPKDVPWEANPSDSWDWDKNPWDWQFRPMPTPGQFSLGVSNKVDIWTKNLHRDHPQAGVLKFLSNLFRHNRRLARPLPS